MTETDARHKIAAWMTDVMASRDWSAQTGQHGLKRLLPTSQGFLQRSRQVMCQLLKRLKSYHGLRVQPLNFLNGQWTQTVLFRFSRRTMPCSMSRHFDKREVRM